MAAKPSRLLIDGPVGSIETLFDPGEAGARDGGPGVAVIAHPHSLYGGSMDNKVVSTLARAFAQCGWDAVRFNFRGVGASQGEYDAGQGERRDMQAVVEHFVGAKRPLALAGFSFGGFVAASLLTELWAARPAAKIVLVGLATSRFEIAPLPPLAVPRTLVLHGDLDDTVPLHSVQDWAGPQNLPVTVVSGVGHFFHGQLPLLRDLVSRHLRD